MSSDLEALAGSLLVGKVSHTLSSLTLLNNADNPFKHESEILADQYV